MLCYNLAHLQQMKLSIKKSKIPGAGKGLFAEELIKRGEKVIEYTGDVITWKECQKRNEGMKDGFGAYYFYVSEKKCIDAQNHLDSLARYANGDAMAIIQNRIGLIGCHPESQHFWYDKNYLKPHWHQGRHNQLLQDFVHDLFSR
jgi:hypothetical protein